MQQDGKGKILGIDYGAKRIGLALSDVDQTMAFPARILRNVGPMQKEIAEVVKKEGVVAIVLGESKDFSGKENAIMQDIHIFADLLRREVSVPVMFEEEFLTSALARRTPQASDEARSRKPRVQEHVDSSAAALILQSYLDKQHG